MQQIPVRGQRCAANPNCDVRAHLGRPRSPIKAVIVLACVRACACVSVSACGCVRVRVRESIFVRRRVCLLAHLLKRAVHVTALSLSLSLHLSLSLSPSLSLSLYSLSLSLSTSLSFPLCATILLSRYLSVVAR